MSRVATADDGAPPVEHVGVCVHAPCGCWRGGAGRRFGCHETGRAPARSPLVSRLGAAASADRRAVIRRLVHLRVTTSREASGRAVLRRDLTRMCQPGRRWVRGIAQNVCVIPQGHRVRVRISICSRTEHPPIIRRAGAVPARHRGKSHRATGNARVRAHDEYRRHVTFARPSARTRVFQQPWWLDAVAPGRWDEVTCEEGGRVVARLPFVVRGRPRFRMLAQSSLTQTLGPWVESSDASRRGRWRVSMSCWPSSSVGFRRRGGSCSSFRR